MKAASIHVIVVSGFYYLVALCLLLAGLVYCLMPEMLKSAMSDNPQLSAMSNAEIALYGGVMILVALLEALLAYKLSRLSKWARWIALAISALGLLWALIALFVYPGAENYIFVVLHAYFIWALTTKYYGK